MVSEAARSLSTFRHQRGTHETTNIAMTLRTDSPVNLPFAGDILSLLESEREAKRLK
jgi:hypothetical protein